MPTLRTKETFLRSQSAIILAAVPSTDTSSKPTHESSKRQRVHRDGAVREHTLRGKRAVNKENKRQFTDAGAIEKQQRTSQRIGKFHIG